MDNNLKNVLGCTTLFCAIHEIISRSYVNNSHSNNEKENFNDNIMDIINLITACLVSIMYIISSIDIGRTTKGRLYGRNKIGETGLLIHISLCIYEIMYNIIRKQNISMLIHHVLLILFFGLALYYNFIIYYASMSGIAEVTNIFLIPLNLMKRNSWHLDKIIYPGLGLFVSFLFARIILLPYVYYLSTKDISSIKEENLIQFYLSRTGLVIIFLLSCYWFYKIGKGLIKEGSKIIDMSWLLNTFENGASSLLFMSIPIMFELPFYVTLGLVVLTISSILFHMYPNIDLFGILDTTRVAYVCSTYSFKDPIQSLLLALLNVIEKIAIGKNSPCTLIFIWFYTALHCTLNYNVYTLIPILFSTLFYHYTYFVNGSKWDNNIRLLWHFYNTIYIGINTPIRSPQIN